MEQLRDQAREALQDQFGLKAFYQVILDQGPRPFAFIEQDIQNSLDREISTEKIGELVMERLKPLDEVAYVRFASVYRQFKDIDSFMRELNKILEER